MAGDQFLVRKTPAGDTDFYLNGSELLSVADTAIFDFLVQGWIGEGSSALMRDSLLSGRLPAVHGLIGFVFIEQFVRERAESTAADRRVAKRMRQHADGERIQAVSTPQACPEPGGLGARQPGGHDP